MILGRKKSKLVYALLYVLCFLLVLFVNNFIVKRYLHYFIVADTTMQMINQFITYNIFSNFIICVCFTLFEIWRYHTIVKTNFILKRTSIILIAFISAIDLLFTVFIINYYYFYEK